MNETKLHICYLLESTELCGGVRVVFDQVRALERRGYQVTIRASAGQHDWYPYQLNLDYGTLDRPFPADWTKPDIVIATFWTTVAVALKLEVKHVFHFCQGYEGDIEEYGAIKEQIDCVYRYSLPKLTVGPWLSDRLVTLFGIDAFPIYTVGQIVDTYIFSPPIIPLTRWLRRIRKQPWRILVVGMFGVKVKAISDALYAVESLRGEGERIRLIRVSSLPLSEKEISITTIDEYHQNLTSQEMRNCYRRADILIAPSLSAEGFGLPLAEAMACGVCCVATDIPSFSAFDKSRDYAVFTPSANPIAMAVSLRSLMIDSALRTFLRHRGPEVAARFKSETVALKLEQVFSALCDNEDKLKR